MRRAVLDQSSAIGSGSAITVATEAGVEFAVTARSPGVRTLDTYRSKQRAIVYNARSRRRAQESVVISAGCISDRACSFAVRQLFARAFADFLCATVERQLRLHARRPPHTSWRSRRASRPSFARNHQPSSNRGRGECRVPNAPAAWCAHIGSKSMHTSIHSGGTGKHPAFPTQWFYGFFRALPGDQLLC